MFVDTHAHIHSKDYELSVEEVLAGAKEAGIEQIFCVGTSVADSQLAIEFADRYAECVAVVGHHPHEAKTLNKSAQAQLDGLIDHHQVVGVGETGLDYYYNHSPQEAQEKALRYQIELALKNDLPLAFHVRGGGDTPASPSAFDDFFRVIDDYEGIQGVVHSFSADSVTLDKVLERDLCVAMNGIMTFTKDERQLEAARRVPLERLLLETDSPFLTPHPKRGKVNQPKNVLLVAEFLAELRGETVEHIGEVTTRNVRELFNSDVPV